MSKKFLSEKGAVLILASLVLMVLLILGSYFLTFVTTESKISRSQIVSTQAYYLAEAGANEAIWRIKNDPEWMEGFENEPFCENWSASFSTNDTLFPKSSYSVQIQNSEFECARGEIISTSTIETLEGKKAQRIIKAKVFKALGSLTKDSPFFTGGTSENIDISASIINVYDGNLFGNNNLNIKHGSQIGVFNDPKTEKKEGKVLAGNNVNLSWDSHLIAEAICSKNICPQPADCLEEGGCPPSSASMPMVDFDSPDPGSYKSQALSAQEDGQCNVLCNGSLCDTRCVFSSSEFDDLLWQAGNGGTLLLESGITYVTGPIELRGGRQLTVMGALVADRTIDIGVRDCWTQKGQKDCGLNHLAIIDPGEGKPSGLLTKRNLSFGPYSFLQEAEIRGLIYTSDEIKLNSLPQRFDLFGGMMGRKISITSAWEGINVYLDNTIILEGIWGGPKPPGEDRPPYSPIVTIEHWEESY